MVTSPRTGGTEGVVKTIEGRFSKKAILSQSLQMS